jgi:hypothetical protein
MLDSKLNFNANTENIVSKARKRLFIMKQLAFLSIDFNIRKLCYHTFIESILTYHLCTIFGHLSMNNINSLNRIIRLASYFSKCDFLSIEQVYQQRLTQRCLARYTTSGDVAVELLPLERLPSGRFRAIKHRVKSRANCFRSKAVKLLNLTLF